MTNGHACWLKGGASVSLDSRPSSGLTVYLKPQPPSPPSACSTDFNPPIADNELYGDAVGDTTYYPVENCCTACANLETCLGFVTNGHAYWLKGGSISLDPRPNSGLTVTSSRRRPRRRPHPC